MAAKERYRAAAGNALLLTDLHKERRRIMKGRLLLTLLVTLATLMLTAPLAAARSESPLPSNETAQAALEARVQSLAQPEPTVGGPLPAIANEISGQAHDLLTSIYMYTFPANLAEFLYGRTMEVTAFSLNFPNGAEAQLDLDFADGYRVSLPVGLDGVWRTTESDFGSIAARGGWAETGNRFVVDYQIVGAATCGKFTFTINDEGALRVVWENLAALVGTRAQYAETVIHGS